MSDDRPYRLTDVRRGYAVVLTPDGERVGHVRRREERFNLRRMYVARWWSAYPDDQPGADGVRYGTRHDAARSLVRITA